MLWVLFFYQLDVNFLLNDDFVCCVYSHRSGSITNEHRLIDILFEVWFCCRSLSMLSLTYVYGTWRTFSDVAFWRLLLQNLRSFLWASVVASMMTFTGDDPHWPHWNPFSKSIVEHNNSRKPYQANLKCAYEKVFWNRRSFDLSWLSLRDKK